MFQDTLIQLQRLTPIQLVHAVKNYRYEVGEKSLAKQHMKFLQQLQKGSETLIRRPVTPLPDTETPSTPVKSSTPQPSGEEKQTPKQDSPATPHNLEPEVDPGVDRNKLLLDQAMMLPFSLPTSTDMLISYGSGIGGVNREQARRYIPTIPTEVLAKLNLDGDGETGRARQGSVSTVAKTWRNGDF